MSLALGGQHSLAVSDPSKPAGCSKHVLPEEHQVYGEAEPVDAPPHVSPAEYETSDHMGQFLLHSWGMGDFGCLGQQHFTSELQPTLVRTFEALTTHHQDATPFVNSIPSIAAAGAHSLLVDRYNPSYCKPLAPLTLKEAIKLLQRELATCPRSMVAAWIWNISMSSSAVDGRFRQIAIHITVTSSKQP